MENRVLGNHDNSKMMRADVLWSVGGLLTICGAEAWSSLDGRSFGCLQLDINV